MTLEQLSSASARATLEAVFDHFDSNRNGDISKGEMRTVLHATVPRATRKQVQEALDQAPFVNNVLSKDDFVQSVDDCIVYLTEINLPGEKKPASSTAFPSADRGAMLNKRGGCVAKRRSDASQAAPIEV